jgi:class 3 adenylate cyclase
VAAKRRPRREARAPWGSNGQHKEALDIIGRDNFERYARSAMVERNAGLPSERRIEFRIGIHVGDVVEESDGDLMGDGVNIAARLEGIAKLGAIYLSEDAYNEPRSGDRVPDIRAII